VPPSPTGEGFSFFIKKRRAFALPYNFYN